MAGRYVEEFAGLRDDAGRTSRNCGGEPGARPGHSRLCCRARNNSQDSEKDEGAGGEGNASPDCNTQ